METPTTTSKISERKAALRETSNTVQELIDSGKIKAANLNDGLLAFYTGKKKNQVWYTISLMRLSHQTGKLRKVKNFVPLLKINT